MRCRSTIPFNKQPVLYHTFHLKFACYICLEADLNCLYTLSLDSLSILVSDIDDLLVDRVSSLLTVKRFRSKLRV